MRLATLAVLLSAVSLAPCLAQQELLQNPSFESLDAKGLPAAWPQYGGGVPESQLSVVATAHTGQRAIRFLDTGPNVRDNKYAIGVSQDVPVTAGRFYLASVWAKAVARNNDQAVVLQLTFMGGAEPKNVSTYILPAVGGDWKRFSVSGAAPDDAKTVRLYVYTMHYWTSDTLIDDVSLREAGAAQSVASAVLQWGQEPLVGPRKLNLRTPLTQAGQPAATIACPNDPQWQKVAQDLQTAIQRKSGATLPIQLVTVASADGKDNRAALSALLKTDRTILALGNLNNNFILERLYWNFYTKADSLWPGAGAYALRTVHQPMNCGDINVLTIDASDLAGAQAGAIELVRRLPDGPDCALDQPLLVVSNQKPMADEARQKLLAGKAGPSLFVDFQRACEAYRDTGDPAWAQQAKRLMLLARDRLVADPQYHLDWPEETTSNGIGKMWDVIEEAPVWTDAERADAENTLFATMIGMRRNAYNWGSFAANDTIVWNHQTFPLLGIYWMARWFERYYPNQEPIADYLAQVHGAFRGQLKSWKPMCDADGYMTITPGHTIEYTLSRNDYRFFESGNVRQFAEYLTTYADNLGSVPGFGDSSYVRGGPGYEATGLPVAFWYYKDPRYLWRLQQLYQGKWKNPYDTTIAPKPWQELAGISVFRMPAEYYKWATTTGNYGEGDKTDVKYEQSFDKISFREDAARDGQYLLLDGFARGRHLHYDGNNITRYHADGEDWLIDGDYLVRNTTDHCMISVIRDGRADQLEPAFTGLDAYADLPSVAYTRTTVSGYNGADWTRNILWLKGEGFIVLDELTAREPGDYTFENVFKMLDQGKLEFDGRTVKVSRPTDGGTGSRELSTVQSPEVGIAKALRFGEITSRLEFPATLPAGDYGVALYGRAKDGGSDSFWLTVDGGEPVACHIPLEKFGPSSAAWTKDVPTPNVRLAQAGLHVFRVTLRENPGTLLQKVVITDKAGKEVANIDASNAPPLPQGLAKPAPDNCFYIKGDGTVPGAITDRCNNVNLKLKYLRHLFGGKLQAGQTVTDQVLFYSDRSDKARGLDIRRVLPRTLLIDRAGKRWGYLTTELGGKMAEALFYCTDRVALINVNPKAWPGMAADQPFSLELDLKTGIATAYAPQPTTLTVDGKPQALKTGPNRLDLSRWSRLKPMREDLARALQATEPQKPAGRVEAASKWAPLQQLWSSPSVMQDEQNVAVVNRLVPADLNGDGRPELLVARGNNCVALDAAGKQLWTIATGGRVNDMCLGDADGDGKPEVVVGSDDENFYIADTAGKVLATTHCDAQVNVGRSSVRDPRVSNVAIGDVDADGKPDLIIGTRNGNIVRYDTDLEKLWAFNEVEHGTISLRLLDLDGDKKLEIVAANRYGSIEVVDGKGRAMPGSYSELGDVVFDVADVNGDGKPDLLNGSSTGAFTCTPWRGDLAWKFDNFGYGVRAVKCADVDGDGKTETILASETGYVYMLNGDGTVKAMRKLSAPVLSLATTEQTLLAGCRDGMAYELNARLEPTKAARLPGPVTQLTILTQGAAPLAVAASGEALAALPL